MITGDYKQTAVETARALGMVQVEIVAPTPEAVAARLLARPSPV
jgi:magnesium-transporting ATPase (P-type)